jgi:hypothetical protein
MESGSTGSGGIESTECLVPLVLMRSSLQCKVACTVNRSAVAQSSGITAFFLIGRVEIHSLDVGSASGFPCTS